MFIERKEYDATVIGYELFDDYNVRVQLTPTQAKELYLWLADRADQIDKDITGEASFDSSDEIAARWKEPNTVSVSLHNGQTVEAEVNGKAFDGKSGSILLRGKPTTVVLEDGQWREL